MFKLDNNFLISMGLGSLPVDEKNKLLQAIYERLEMNVGMRLAERMTEEQLVEFEQYMDRKDEAGALRWLETNFPNYKQVVAEELEKLKSEVSQSAPQILAASQGAQGQQVQPGQPAPAPMPAQTPTAPYTDATAPQPYQQPMQPAQPAADSFAPQQPQQPVQSDAFAQPSAQVQPNPTQDFGATPPQPQAQPDPQAAFAAPAPQSEPQTFAQQNPAADDSTFAQPQPVNPWPGQQPPAGPSSQVPPFPPQQ